MGFTEEERRSLLGAAADNHRVWFRRTASAHGAGVVGLHGGELCLGPEAMIFPRPDAELDVDGLMAEIRARECASVGCWSLNEDPRLATRLMARGFGWGWQPHWMAGRLAPPGDAPHGDAPPDAAGDIPPTAAVTVAPAAPPYARTLPYAPRGPAPPGTIRLGVRLREKVVGQVTVNPDGDVAGIYDMGVVPKVRRRGIGLALIRASGDAAARRGARHAVLNATSDGARLYRRAGFQTLGLGRTWWWSPRPEPTARQRQLAEAIGDGDAGALSALAPSRAELADALPCGERPLGLALLLDRPGIAERLLDREPGLAHPGPTGPTLLHRAVEHDRPAFAELALARGVDPETRDPLHHATALQWVEHLGRSQLAERLRRAAHTTATLDESSKP